MIDDNANSDKTDAAETTALIRELISLLGDPDNGRRTIYEADLPDDWFGVWVGKVAYA